MSTYLSRLADVEQALDEMLTLQAQQQNGDVSIELVMALAKVSYAMEALAIARPTLSLRIKPSPFDQMVKENSIDWAATERPAADALRPADCVGHKPSTP